MNPMAEGKGILHAKRGNFVERELRKEQKWELLGREGEETEESGRLRLENGFKKWEKVRAKHLSRNGKGWKNGGGWIVVYI